MNGNGGAATSLVGRTSPRFFPPSALDLDDLTSDLGDWAARFSASSLVGFAQSFVFPGGNTLAFSDVGFSDNQDLVAHNAPARS